MKWAYVTRWYRSDEFQDRTGALVAMNAMGAECWEAFHIIQETQTLAGSEVSGVRVFFKRIEPT